MYIIFTRFYLSTMVVNVNLLRFTRFALSNTRRRTTHCDIKTIRTPISTGSSQLSVHNYRVCKHNWNLQFLYQFK